MNELIKSQLKETREAMEKALSFTEAELTKIRAGKAMPSMLDGVIVDYYGNPTPLNQVGNISTPDARTLIIQPWEKNFLGPVEKAIIDSNLGLNPQNDGNVIRLVIPPLTEERRKDLVKRVKDEAEKGKISVRNLRKEANDKLRKLKNDGLSEDEIKDGEAEIQKLTDAFTSNVDQVAETKEKDILTI